MNKISILLVAILALLPLRLAHAVLVDRVVAVVNDNVITLSEVEQEGKKLFQQIARQAPAPELAKDLDKARREVLSSLIDKTLVKQKAKALGITVDDKEISRAMAAVAADNHMDVETMKGKLVAQGISIKDYRNRLKWQILQSKVINYEIRSKIVITDAKARQYYKQQGLQDIHDGYHILQIGLQWGTDKKYPTREMAMEQAKQIENMLHGQQSFTELARTYSDLPSAADGGDLGFFAKNDLASFMKAAILKMKPGETSPIIEGSNNTLQILKLLSIKTGNKIERPPFKRVKQDIIFTLQNKELDHQYARWLKDLRAQAYIKTIL